MKFEIVIILFVLSIAGDRLFSQSSDLKLIRNQTFEIAKYEKRRIIKFGITENKSPVILYNPVALTLSSLLFTYQKWLSPQISVDCLYFPSCSEYTKLLFKRYGLVAGFITSSDRLMRCDRISATTINPISVDDHDGKVHESVERYVLCKEK